MNNTVEDLTAQYKPEYCIVAYSHNSNYYLEHHRILDGKMQVGKPLKQSMIQDMVDYFDKTARVDASISGAISANIKYVNWGMGKKIMAWTNPSQERMMHFANELHIKGGIAHQPELLYILKNGDLDIYAINEAGQVFRAPYHNVSENGSVCLGSARLAAPRIFTFESVIKHYETLFWKSEFSHLHGDTSPISGNLNTYWKEAIAKKSAFDNSVLLPMKTTLTEIIEEL